MKGQIKNGILRNGYVPHAGQIELHNCPARFRICVCGRRWGKTLSSLNELYKQAWMNKDKLARCWYVAPNYRQAKTVAWEMIKEVIPEQVIQQTNEAELSIRLINGTLIELKGADSQDSLRGAKLKFAILDEYASMRATAWDEVIRPAMADVPGSRAMFIGTPSGFNHFKVLFDKGNSGDPDFKSFRFKTSENPYVDPKEIEDIRQKTNPTIFRQEYEASFEQMSGSVYPMFKRDTHVVKPHPIDDEWDRIVGLDWGSRNPTAVAFAAISPEGIITIYDVWQQAGLTVRQWADKLKMREDFEKLNSWVIDPSALAQAREFGQYGIYFTSYNPETLKKLNDVNIGINLTSQYLLEGKIRIFDHCEELVTQMEQYQWLPGSSKLGADPRPTVLKKDDHCCFVSGTEIYTTEGWKPVEKISDFDVVLTRKGWRYVDVASETGEKEVISCLFSNGSVLTGTKDHPIFSDGKKISLDALRYLDTVDAWIPKKTIRDTAKQHVGDGVRLMGLYLKGIISTISTKTQRTMFFPTSSLCLEANTCQDTEEQDCQTWSIWKKSDHLQSNGIGQRKDANGIASMALDVGNSVQRLKRLARFVEKSSQQKTETKNIDFVGRTARWLIEDVCGKIWKLVPAKFAEKIFNVISIFLRNAAQESAPRLVAKSRSRLSKVYNLQIEDVHEYFANGICVSNCDALRYLIMARPTGHKSVEKKYKGLDAKSEMFWRAHNNDMPKEMELLMPRDSGMFGIDEEYATLSLEDIW